MSIGASAPLLRLVPRLAPLDIILVSKSFYALFEVVEELLIPLRMPYLGYLKYVVVEQLILNILTLIIEHAGQIIHKRLRCANVVPAIHYQFIE